MTRMADDSEQPQDQPTPWNGPASRRWLRWFAVIAFLLLLPVLLLIGLLGTERGSQTLAGLLPRLTGGQVVIDGISGRLSGQTHIERLRIIRPDMHVDLREVSLNWHPWALRRGRLDIEAMSVASVDIATRPAEDSSAAVPPSPFTLPVDISVASAKVGRLAVHEWQQWQADGAFDRDAEPRDDAPPPSFEAHDLTASLQSDRRRHHIEGLSAVSPWGTLTLNGWIDMSASPFPLSASGTFSGSYAERNFSAAFSADGDLLQPHLSAKLSGDGAAGKIDAIAVPFEPVPLKRAEIALSGIDPSQFHPSAPQALLSLNAELTPQSADTLSLQGPVEIINHSPATIDDKGVPVERLTAQIAWMPARASVTELSLTTIGGGRVSGNVDWHTADSDFGTVSALLSLADIQPQRLDSRLPLTQVNGELRADGTTTEQHAEADIRIDDARIQAQGTFTPAADAGPAAFSLAGTLANFNPATIVATVPAANLNLHFDGEGTLSKPLTMKANWRFDPSTFNNLPLEGHGVVALRGERIEQADIVMNLAGNTATAKGAWGSADAALAIEIDAPALQRLGMGLAGQATASGRLSGTLEKPAGRLLARAEALQLPGDIAIGNIDAEGQLDDGPDGPFRLHLVANRIGKHGSEAWSENVALAAEGSRRQHDISLVATTPQTDALRIHLSGGIQEATTGTERVFWQGRVTQLESQGRLPLRLTAPSELLLSPQRIELSATRLDGGEHGYVTLTQTRWTPNELVASGSLSGLVVDLREQRPQRRARGRRALQLGAEWDLRLTEQANGYLHIFRQEGDLFLPGQNPVRVALEQAEGRITLQNNRIDMQAEVRGEELGVVAATASAMLERVGAQGWRLAMNAPLRGEALLDMPSIEWLARAFEENIDLGGSLKGRVALSGTPADPVMLGGLEGEQIDVALLDEGLRLDGGRIRLDFDRERLRLSELTFISPNRVVPEDDRLPVAELTAEPGRLTGGGEMRLEDGVGSFAFDIDRLPLLQRVDRWLVLSGQARIDTSWQRMAVVGQLNVDAGYIHEPESAPPRLSDDVVVIGEEETPRRGMELHVDIKVALGENLYLVARGLDTRLEGQLQVSDGGEGLSAVGSVQTVGGVFRGYGQNLTLERGVINFQGPLNNPGLNVVALRKGLQVEAGIEVTGTIRRPQVRLVSEPEVSDPEKLSWIVLGHAPSAGSSADLGVLLPAAQELLGMQGGGITGQLSRGLGLDEFGIGQGELGSVTRSATSQVVGSGSTVDSDAATTGQVLMLGKRLSSDLFLSFEQSLGGAETLVKLTYQLSRRVSVVARGGTDNSGDIYYTVSFR